MVKRILEACKERSIITLNEHLWIFLLMFFVSATEILLSGNFIINNSNLNILWII